MLLPRYANLTTNFRGPQFREEIAPSWLKHMYSVLSTSIWRRMLPAACSRLCCEDSSGEQTYFHGASLWLLLFLWGDHKPDVLAPSSFCVWNQIPWRNLQTRILLLRGFCINSFDDSTDCQNLWCCRSIPPKILLKFSKNFLNFRSDAIDKLNKCRFIVSPPFSGI